MDGEIGRAVERLDDRKRAFYPDLDRKVDLVATPLSSGLDLDPRELSEFCKRTYAMFGLADDPDPANIAAALAHEGLLIGLLIAEARGREACA